MENQKQILPIQPDASNLPGISDLLKRTWQVYKTRLGTFFGIMSLPIFPIIIIGILYKIRAEIIYRSFGISISPFWHRVSEILLKYGEYYNAFFIILFLFLSLISAFLFFWASVSLLYAIKERETKLGIKKCLQKGWHKIIPFVWISILVGFITTGGFLLLIIPGVILRVWLSLAIFVLISEDLKGMNALFRSKQWVEGYWWKVFWRLFVITLLSIVVFSPTFFLKKEIGKDIIEGIISLFWSPFCLTYSFLIYEDLKKVKGEIPFELPKKRTKIKYILVGVLGFLLIPIILISFVFTSFIGAKSKARDAKREIDLRQFWSAQEMYYTDNDRYYTSTDREGTPPIPIYLESLDDPQAPAKHYKWLDNTACPQKFCVYALMENSGRCGKGIKRYFAVSERGSKEICGLPPTSGCNCFGTILEEKAPEEIEKPYIKILSPSGGEEWVIGNTYEIKWESQGVEGVYIFITDMSSPSKELIRIRGLGEEVPAAKGSFSWTIPKNIFSIHPDWNPGDDFRITVCEAKPAGACGIYDENEIYFKIVSSYLNVISPNGGEIWRMGEDREIKWDSRGVDKIDVFLIDYSYSPEVSVKIGEVPTSGKFVWEVTWDISELNPNWKFGDNFKIKICEKKPDGTCGLTDESDDYFKIVKRIFHLNLLSPNGGEKWKAGESYEIKWESQGIDKIKIEITDWSYSPGISVTLVEDYPANLGKYLWSIPLDISKLNPNWKFGDNFTIDILEKQPGGSYKSIDGSDDYFTIIP
jgi:type II secretory pathway pseudopilin PulG